MKTRKIVVTILTLLILFTIVPNVPTRAESSYDLSKVAYYDRVKQALNLTAQEESMLEKYGFTTAELMGKRFEDFYWQNVYNPDLPVFVTTDSILHLYHVVFDCSLRIIEYQVFYPMISDVTQYAFQKSLNDYNSIPHDGSVKYWAIRNATAYFAVAKSLISGENATVPSELSPDVNFYLNEIYAKTPEFVYAGGWNFTEPPYNVEVKYDFTQFTVRGHYVGSPRLAQYFRTMMWYGSYPIFIHRNDENYTWVKSHIDDPALVYMRDIFKQNPARFDEWMTLYNVTSVLVGESDSITLLTLETALHNTFGDKDQYLDLVAASDGLAVFRTELAKPEYAQQILGQALVTLVDPSALPRYPLVFQFMGQRYVPDSYMFQMLCWDKVGYDASNGRRIMPKGLDVFAVLGSERAYQLLFSDFAYENYTNNLDTLKSKFNNLAEDEWTQSSYTAWMHSLQSLVNVEDNNSYPEFMTNLAWQDEKLNTALGSWTQLRHDTLLYSKETYIPSYFLCSYPEAFVEPNPTFYSRMQQLSEKTIEAVNMLPTNSVASIPMMDPIMDPIFVPSPTTIIVDSLETIKSITQKLETISTKELTRQPLTTEETDFIKQIALTATGSGGSNATGWYVDTITNIAMAANYTDLLDVPLIADVATFPPGDWEYPPQILHVGVGYVNALVVLYPQINGSLVAAVGPIFSYYEFPLIGTKRLNDNEWQNMLTLNNRTAYLPYWIKDIYGMQDAILPEQPTVIMLMAAIMVMFSAVAAFKWVDKTKKTSKLPQSRH